MIDEAKLNELMGRMLGDLGGAMSIALVRMGDSLGLYKALHNKGPLTPAGLAAATGTAERYVREWLAAQAAADYVAYDKATGTFSLPPEQAMVFADEDSPVFLMGAFDAAAAMLESQSKVQAAFKTGGGVQWGDQAGCCFCATARFFRPGLSREPGCQLVARTRRRCRQARRRRNGGRCRLRSRAIDHHNGRGFPQVAVHRLRLS